MMNLCVADIEKTSSLMSLSTRTSHPESTRSLPLPEDVKLVALALHRVLQALVLMTHRP